MRTPPDTAEVVVAGRRLRLTSLTKPLWPRAGFTKGAMLEYYAHAAGAIVPQLTGRPCTLARFPEGIDRYGWYQTQCRGCPEWMRTCAITVGGRPTQRYCVVEDEASLLWAANVGAVEFHPLLARCDRLDEPTSLVFDLDPGPPAGVAECCDVALHLRELLDELGMRASVKTSGSLGLHVVVPLAPGAAFAQTKAFARGVARAFARRLPDMVVDRQARDARTGRVLIDWLQNDANRSTVAAWSLRATLTPMVSTPLGWGEVKATARDRRDRRLLFGPSEALERLEAAGDPFAATDEEARALPSLEALDAVLTRSRGGAPT